MLKFLTANQQSVQNDTGFIFRSKSRFTMEYVEEARVMTLEVEHGRQGDNWCVAVRSDTLNRWQPPHENEPIAPERRNEIRANIQAALEFMGAIPVFA